MKPKFPHIWNGATAKRSDGDITFTYIDSYGDVITETKGVLSPSQIARKVVDRMGRF